MKLLPLTDRDGCYAMLEAIGLWNLDTASLIGDAPDKPSNDDLHKLREIGTLAEELSAWADTNARHINAVPFLDTWLKLSRRLARYAGAPPRWLPDWNEIERASLRAEAVVIRIRAHTMLALEALAGKEATEPASVDESAYLPADWLRTKDQYPENWSITRALEACLWVRRLKPSPQRLLVHAADWARMLRTQQADPMNYQAGVVDEVLAQERRREEIRAAKRKEGG